MSVSGVGSGASIPDPSAVDTRGGEAASTAPERLDFGPFASLPFFERLLAGETTLAMGAEGPEVQALEDTLVALGYGLPGRGQPNARFTRGTVNAIARFQRDHGLDPTGVLDAATLKRLDDVAVARLGQAVPAEPRPTDFVPKPVLERYGLSTDSMTTESHYKGQEWGSVGYYPYDGDVQYIAFAKHKSVFGGNAAEDAHGFFEFYSNPPSGLRSGSWIMGGHIRESSFETTAGVDVSGNRPIDNAAYKLLRESGAPQGAKFALRTESGEQIPVQDGDQLVPTLRDGDKVIELEIDGEANYSRPDGGELGWNADVVWRIKRDGKVLFSPDHKAETREGVLGLDSDVKFDFLDASGNLVGYRPPRDRIVESWKDGDAWHVLAKKGDGFEHQVIKGETVESTETLDAQAAAQLKEGKEIIHRVQDTATGALKGDGKVSDYYNMGWWGKCHNVASLSTTSMPRPQKPVEVVTNLREGDEVGLRWGDNVLVPQRGAEGAITGYAHQVRDSSGAVASSREISVEQARQLAEANGAEPVVVGRDGTLREAETTQFDTESLTALVSHIGNGAVEYVGGAGARYYARPDVLVKKDGTQIEAHIASVRYEDGSSERIGARRGIEFSEDTRDPLRSPGMDSRVIGDGTGRRYAFNVNTFDRINEYREKEGKPKITELVLLNPDGTEQTVKADEIEIFGWENKYDFRPDELWDLHKTVTEDRSTVIETYTGTQVWNYAARDVETTVIDPAELASDLKAEAAKPGMMAGTTGEEGKVYFETTLETDGGTKRVTYWVRFDDQGNVSDYRYLSGQVPDFVWTQYVKKDREWTGESQAPGVMNRDIQRLYFASTGRLDSYMLPGGVIASPDLKSAPPAPEQP